MKLGKNYNPSDTRFIQFTQFTL